jgi:2,4-dienoyl-CoA reductase (NADPH2)
MAKYERVLSPIKINKLEIKNRLSNSSAIPNFSKRSGELTQREIDYFVEKAKGGIGIVVTSATSVNSSTAKGFLLQAGLHSDDFIPQYKILTDAIRSYGARSSVQVYHPGRSTHPMNTGGVAAEGPRELGCPIYSHYPAYEYNVMTTERVKAVIQEFAELVRRAKEAGFDMVELHGAHGYLMTAFASPSFGPRPFDDGYGDSYKENRLKFHREVMEAIRLKVGPDYPVGIRYNVDDFVDGGTTLEDGIEMAKMFEEMGYDFLGVSGGVYSYDALSMHSIICPSMYLPPLHLEYAAAAIKEVVSIPVMQFGGVSSLEVAEGILERGTADIVQMNRQTWADPHIVNKTVAGKEDDVRHCIRCNNGCIDRLMHGLDCCCTMNPEMGRERLFAEKLKEKAAKNKKVLVIGGGPAGMTCARYAKLMGHEVILVEKKQELGGANLYSSKGPNREEFGELTNYYSRQVNVLGVDVRLGEEATIEKVKSIGPDVVVVATGSRPKIPVIKGIRDNSGKLSPNVVTAWEALGQEKEIGENVVVVGGNHIGLQAALALVDQGKKVTVMECLPMLNQDLDGFLVWNGYIMQEVKRCEEEGTLKVLNNMYVKEIKADGVICEPPGKTPATLDIPSLVTTDAEEMIKCDTVVVGTGRESVNKIFDELQGAVPELYAVGDCVKPRWTYTATGEGATLGIEI